MPKLSELPALAGLAFEPEFWSNWPPRVEDFSEAIDADDVQRATSLMKKAKIDASTIAMVIRKMEDADGEH